MLQVCYPRSLTEVLKFEGGYTNHPADPGGPTNYGITIYDVRLYVKPNATAADVRALSLGQAKAIYRAKYWDRCRCDDLPAGLDFAVFDYGVNSGVARSIRILRGLVGQPTSSTRIDDATLAAVAKRDPDKLIDALCAERMRFLRKLRTFPTFGRGWTSRVNGVLALGHWFAKTYAAGAPAQPELTTVTPPASEPSAKGMVTLPEPGKKSAAAATAGGGGILSQSLDWVHAHPVGTVLIVLGCIIVTVSAIYGIRRYARYLTEKVPADLVPVPVKG